MTISSSSAMSLTTTSIMQAAQWLESGQLLAYPTESVWGIGCDPFDRAAVQQLLTIKQRSVDKGMIVITDSVQRITPLLTALSPQQRQVVVESWCTSANKQAQQAHTWLLPLPDQLKVTIPSWITGAHDKVAVRVIAHPLIQQLCTQLLSTHNPYGFIVSTSCNPSGQPPALTLAQAQDYFLQEQLTNGMIDGHSKQIRYLQGETLDYKLPSQISDALTGKIVR